MEDLPKIPYYHVARLISQGGTAAVYLGVDLRSGFPVAIKALFPRRAANEYVLRKFKEEANNYLYMSHPNLTKLVDFVADERHSRYYLMMEYIDGTPLDLYINTQTGPMSDEVVIPMFLQILDTVAYIHQNRKLHLDIKPNNIMVTRKNKIKLLDMGISVKINEQDIRKAGTPPFMSPEQQTGEGLGFYSDVFALGVTLFNMVTGQLPFRGTSTEILEQNRLGIRPQITDFYPSANIGFQPIIERAMNPDRHVRYQTCEEMMNDIIELQKSQINLYY